MNLLLTSSRRLALLALLVCAPSEAFAERTPVPVPRGLQDDSPPAPSNADGELETPTTWRGQRFVVRSSIIDGRRHVQLFDSRGKLAAEQAIPRTALSSVDNLQLIARETPVRGNDNVLDVRIEGRAFGGAVVAYQSVFGLDARGRTVLTVWSGRLAEAETGDTFHIEDLDGDGKDELVLYAQTPTVTFCGRTKAPLFPRVWDTKSQSFRPVHLRPALPSGTRRIDVRDEAPERRWSVGTELRSVSSSASRAVDRSYGRAPSSLSDGDDSTVWLARTGSGEAGDFISAQINPAAGLAGFAYTLPEDPALRPKRLLLSTQSGTFDIAIPANQRSGYAALPEVMSTDCATISIVETASRSRGVGFAELHFYTGLDVGGAQESLEARVFAPYRQANNAIERNRIAQLMRVNDPALVEGAIAMLPTLDLGQQAPVVDALMSSELGQKAVYAELSHGKLSSAAIAAVGRSLSRGEGQGIDELYLVLERSNDQDTRESLLRVVSRTVTSQDALRLLPLVTHASSSSRADIAFGLGQAQFTDIDTLLSALEGKPEIDLVLLRAVSRIARRQAGRHPAQLHADAIEKLNQAMDDENGTVARVAYQLSGILGVTVLRPRLLDAFENDPNAHIRLAALKGLAEYDRYFAEDTGNTVLLIDALESEDPSIRIAAAQLLRERTLDELEINFIVSTLKKEIWTEASRPLVVALIRQSRSDVDQRVADLLLHLDPSMLRTAFVTWQSRQTPPSFAALNKVFDRARPNETYLIAWTRAAARVETEEAAHALRTHFADERLPLRARTALLEALGRQRMASNLPVLMTQLAESGSVDIRRAAARGLAWYDQHPEAQDALESAREHERNETVLDAVSASLKALDMARTTRELLRQN